MTLMRNIRKREAKIPVEKLQEDFLQGPADGTAAEASEALNEYAIVPVVGKVSVENIIFRNQRDPGYPLEFHYSSKTHPFKQYKLIDGQKYAMPTEVVKNLESCRENIEKYRRNAEGIPEIYVAGYKTHFVCERA